MKFIIPIILILFNLFYIYSQSEKCSITYSANLYGNFLISFSAQSENSNNIIRYLWDFGDGTSSSLQSPYHLYLKSDTYYVCLTVTYSDGCIATSCDSIFITDAISLSRTGNKIHGHIYVGNNLLPEGAVILISIVNDKYKAIAATKIVNGHYFFNNIPLGKYFLYAIPRFNVTCNYFPHYLPTYSGNVTYWANASNITFNDTNVSVICNIQLYADYSFYAGNDSIYGYVYVEDTLNFEYNVYFNLFGDKVNIDYYELHKAPHQVILLYDKYNKLLNFALTDLNGYFTLKNLPSDIFKVKLERHGINSAVFTSNTTSQNFVKFVIQKDTITINVKSNFYKEHDAILILQNPVENYLTLKVNSSSNFIFLHIYNSSGIIVYSEKITIEKNSNEIIFVPLALLKKGVYFLKVSDLNSHYIKPFIKN
ncbi:MAG: PKD domain-containing protein [Bacteroidales bacterium]|nr:PKD domain-containing protein [Bacteroidales bacterium]